MRKLISFDSVTLDGYFSGPDGDISWAHSQAPDEEFNDFVADNAKSGGMLVMGRVTYEMMSSYWPTAQAAKDNPVVAKSMNELPKIVFSKTMDKADWSNTRLVKDGLEEEIGKLKRQSGKDMTILGSGTLVAQLTEAGLIDEYQMVVIPVVIGEGRTLFDGIDKTELKPTKRRAFGNGNLLLCYEPARQ